MVGLGWVNLYYAYSREEEDREIYLLASVFLRSHAPALPVAHRLSSRSVCGWCLWRCRAASRLVSREPSPRLLLPSIVDIFCWVLLYCEIEN
jgi:hypothetical protein